MPAATTVEEEVAAVVLPEEVVDPHQARVVRSTILLEVAMTT